MSKSAAEWKDKEIVSFFLGAAPGGASILAYLENVALAQTIMGGAWHALFTLKILYAINASCSIAEFSNCSLRPFCATPHAGGAACQFRATASW